MNGTYVNGLKVTLRVRVSLSDTITLGLTIPMPWPSQIQPNTFKSLTIGRDPENDLVVGVATVSGRHARLVWEGKPDEAIVEDLGSSTGTAIQTIDRRIQRAPFTTRDIVYLGTHPLHGAHLIACLNPAATPALEFSGDAVVIGRDLLCHRVIDLPMISSRHASLTRQEQGLWIEDLGSVNGTFVNGVRIQGRTRVKVGDILGFGSHSVRLTEPTPKAPPTVAFSPTATANPSGSTFDASFIASMPAAIVMNQADRDEDGASHGFGAAFGRLWTRPTTWISLLLLGPTAAILIAMSLRGDPTHNGSILYWTSFAAVGLGLYNAVLLTNAASRSPLKSLISIIGKFCSFELATFIQCLLLWGMVSKLTSIDASWLGALGLLALGSSVGLSIGLVVTSIAGRQAVALVVCFILLAVFAIGGGGSRTHEAAHAITGAIPTRWVFEGMLLLGTDHPFVETEFPAETERMGVRADVFALAFMFVGFSVAWAFFQITSEAELRRPNP